VATHMPFFDGETLVFCESGSTLSQTIQNQGTIWKRIHRNKTLAERFKDLPRSQEVPYRAWKLRYCNWADKQVRPISTGLSADIPERAPCLYKEGGKVHLSFVAGKFPNYSLYTCSGADLDSLEAPVPMPNRPLIFGFVSQHHICWGAGNTIRLSEKATGKAYRFMADGLTRVSSVNFLSENQAKLLITGHDKEHAYHTVLYDLGTGEVQEVLAGGPVYKSSLHANQIVFSTRLEEGFENRQLCSGDCTFSPSAIRISKGE
jgi:hypothetical protein